MTLTITAETWSPAKVIAFGYFDGPAEGVLKLDDGQVFRFVTVEEDQHQERRVCTLAALEPRQFDDLVQVLGSALGPPKWPLWVPLWHFADKDLQRVTEQSVDAILGSAKLSGVVLCSDNLERCFAARPISDKQRLGVTSWLVFLNAEDKVLGPNS